MIERVTDIHATNDASLQDPPILLFRDGCVIMFSDPLEWLAYLAVIIAESGSLYSDCNPKI